MINLRNDYNSIGDKKIIESLLNHIDEKYIGYGFDDKSKELNDLVNNIIGFKVKTYCLAGGTLTNVIGLNQILKESYHAVMTVKTSHINLHETGALETSGHKIIEVNYIGGKIDINDIEKTFNLYNETYMVKPKCLYLSNATELGETYTLEELKEISAICKKSNLYFFIDGARLPQALIAEKYNLKDIASLCDMFYLGGTKNGLPYGELLIITNESLFDGFDYLIKNRLGLLAKGFVLANMFITYLKDDYYLVLANKTLNNSLLIKEELKDYIIYPNKTNQTFLIFDEDVINKIKNDIDFEIWERQNDKIVIRLVTSFDTKREDVIKAISIINKVL